MKILNTDIEGLKVVKLDIHRDDRGFFVEKFKLSEFEKAGLPTKFLQENHSRSFPRVIRGLHYQFNPPQGKLVSCSRGRIYDVAVDIRKDSKTLGQHFGIELDQSTLLWIPPGFAHGFCTIGDEPADLIYKITDGEYNSKGEGGIIYNDIDININWKIKSPVISQKDKNLQSFKDYMLNPRF